MITSRLTRLSRALSSENAKKTMGKIFRTAVYKADLRRIYAYSLRHFGAQVAQEAMRQIQALADPTFGKVDARYHSKIFRYKTTRNSQSVFFHAIGDDVVLITTGYCGREWGTVLNRLEETILQQIKNI
jgi:plasmid stabilization system protein ParE